MRPSSLPRAAVASIASTALSTACAGHRVAPVRPTVPASDPTFAVIAAAATVSESDLAYLRGRLLLVPVAHARTRALSSSFEASRDAGARAHLALDIVAPRGTPVLAADDGRVWTVRANSLGGLTVYTVDPGERFVFYYAHLDRYRPGLADGMPLLKGDTLGFVGTTGNAPADTPHLHFQVARIGPDHRWWTGTPIDPLPFLRDAEIALGPRAGATPAATAVTAVEAPLSIVVPAMRVRRPTVPSDTAAADSGRRSTPRGPRH